MILLATVLCCHDTTIQCSIRLEQSSSSFLQIFVQMRRDMVDQKEGLARMTVKVPMDKMRRVTVCDQGYFYHQIPNSPFSLGIAVPREYGKYQVKGGIQLGDSDSVDGLFINS